MTTKKSIYIVFGCFIGLMNPIFAQQIFQKGTLHFRDGKTLEVDILEDSYKSYANGVTYKTSTNGPLKKAGYAKLKGFEVGKNQKYTAFKIEQILPTTTTPTTLIIFLKQLEEGALNLYEFANSENTRWLYIQKNNETLQKLYVIRKDFASEERNQVPIKVDSLATTLSPEAGLFRFEKKFKIILRDATKELTNLKIPNDLAVKPIRKFVKSYNDNYKGRSTKSYFNQKAGFRVFLTSNYFPINRDRTHSTGTVGEEIEFLFNSERKRTTMSLGLVHRAKVSKEKIDLPNVPPEDFTAIRMSQFYLRANSYLNIQNQLKPFFFSGIKLTYASKGRDTYELLDGNSFEGNPSIFALFNVGIGTLYDFKNGAVIKVEMGTKVFPDFKIGFGWKLQR